MLHPCYYFCCCHFYFCSYPCSFYCFYSSSCPCPTPSSVLFLILIYHHHNDCPNHYHQVSVLPHHIALSCQLHLNSIFNSPSFLSISDTSLSPRLLSHILSTFSFLLFYFLSAGANGKGSIGIGINSRVKEVVNQKASNVIEVSSSHNHTIMMMITISLLD